MQLGIAKRGFILAIDVKMCFRVLEYIETLFFNIVAVWKRVCVENVIFII